MTTSQTRPRTPPSEYGPSLTPPTLEEINLRHVSVDVEPSENNANGSSPLPAAEDKDVVVTETVVVVEAANGDSNNNASAHIGPTGLIIIYLGLIAGAMLMAAVIIILIRLIKYSDHYRQRRAALIIWCIVEFVWRLFGIYTTIKSSPPAAYTIFHSLGIFLGKEYYVTLVNSFWPDHDPFTASFNQPGLRINERWMVDGMFYAAFNLIFGIWFWAETCKAINHSSNSKYSTDYEESLATGGLVSCLINVIAYILLFIFIFSSAKGQS